MNYKTKWSLLLSVIILCGASACGSTAPSGSGPHENSSYEPVNTDVPTPSSENEQPVEQESEVESETPVVLPPMPGTGIPKSALSFEFVRELPFAASSQDIECFQDKVYVLNTPSQDAGVIYIFNGPNDGSPGTVWDGLGHFNDPQRFSLDKTGKIYVADVGNDTIAIIDPNHGWLMTEISHLPSAYAVAVDDFGLIYVADNSLNPSSSEKHSRILLIDPSTHRIIGSMADLDAQYLSGLHIRDGFLYAVDHLDGDVRVYDLNSRSLVYTLHNEDLLQETTRDDNLLFVEDVFVDAEGRIFWANSSWPDPDVYYIDDVLDESPTRINPVPGSMDDIRGGGLTVCGDYLYVAMGVHAPALGVRVYRVIK